MAVKAKGSMLLIAEFITDLIPEQLQGSCPVVAFVLIK
jgi:hypothetical protein